MGLHDVTITSEFRKDFDGSGEFSMSFDGEADNGLKTSGFATFNAVDPSGFTAGLKVGGKF